MSNGEEYKKNLEVLLRAAVLAQTKGALSLKDASLVHQSVKNLTSEKKFETLKEKECIDTLVQASVLGQKGGAYSLDDANAVFHAVKWFEDQPKEEVKEL